MSTEEKLQAIRALLMKAPRPESVQTIQSAVAFKKLAAKSRSIVGKNARAVSALLDQLKLYY